MRWRKRPGSGENREHKFVLQSKDSNMQVFVQRADVNEAFIIISASDISESD